MTNGKSGGIQPAGKKSLQEAQPKASGDFVDMQEMLPVMATFQDHLASEQRKHRAQVRGLILMFVVLFGAFLAAPVYYGSRFLEQAKATAETQKASQEQLSQSLTAAMNSLTLASRDLRDELARQRVTTAPTSAPAEAPPVASEEVTKADPASAKTATPPPAPEHPAPSVEIKPAPSPAVEMKPGPAPQEKATDSKTEPSTKSAERPAEKAEEKVSGNALEKSAGPTPATNAPSISALPAEAPTGDLESLLKQVEQAISEKERELQSRKP